MKFEVQGEEEEVYVGIEDYSEVGARVEVLITKENPERVGLD